MRRFREPDSFLPFGDIDERGTYLGDVLRDCFDGDFAAVGNGGRREVRCSSSELHGDELRLVLHHGEGGVAADIMDSDGQLRLHQVPEDKQLLRCGALFHLPRNETIGFWAVHINGGHSATELIRQEMTKRFKDRVSERMLIVTPFAPSAVVEEALEAGQLNTVKLVKLAQPSDLKDARKWVPTGTQARIEVRISAADKAKRLLPGLVRDAMDRRSGAYNKIIEFEGMKFDSAKFELAVDGGARRRTFNVQNVKEGHPYTADIKPVIRQGEATDASIFSELANVISEIQ